MQSRCRVDAASMSRTNPSGKQVGMRLRKSEWMRRRSHLIRIPMIQIHSLSHLYRLKHTMSILDGIHNLNAHHLAPRVCPRSEDARKNRRARSCQKQSPSTRSLRSAIQYLTKGKRVSKSRLALRHLRRMLRWSGKCCTDIHGSVGPMAEYTP